MNIINENIGKKVSQPEEVAEICKAILKAECAIDQDKEHFWVFGLDTKNKIKYIELVSLGSLTGAIVYPREVFRLAIMQAVRSILVAHNHPSGDPFPSKEDLVLTKLLTESGKLLEIPVLDHVIVSGSGYFSFQQSNCLFSNTQINKEG